MLIIILEIYPAFRSTKADGLKQSDRWIFGSLCTYSFCSPSLPKTLDHII